MLLLLALPAACSTGRSRCLMFGGAPSTLRSRIVLALRFALAWSWREADKSEPGSHGASMCAPCRQGVYAHRCIVALDLGGENVQNVGGEVCPFLKSDARAE